MHFSRIPGLLTLPRSPPRLNDCDEDRRLGSRYSAIHPVISCETLANSDFTALDARITSAAATTRNGHPFCDVKGYISPSPSSRRSCLQSWRGDYLQQGCGGLCGKADVSLDDPSRTSGYQAPYPAAKREMVSQRKIKATRHRATATRSGRTSAYGRVFGYSSEHQLARAMKAIVPAYYGRKPICSYFSGVLMAGTKLWFSTSVTRPTSTASLPALPRQLGAPRWPGWTLGRRRQPGQSRQADSDRGEASRFARGSHGGLRRPERYNHGPPRMYVRSCKHALLGGLGSTELPDRRADPRGSRRISHPTDKDAMACSTAENHTAPNWPGPVGSLCRQQTPRRPLTPMARESVSRS